MRTAVTTAKAKRNKPAEAKRRTALRQAVLHVRRVRMMLEGLSVTLARVVALRSSGKAAGCVHKVQRPGCKAGARGCGGDCQKASLAAGTKIAKHVITTDISKKGQ
jgi:hypothetical protein